MLKNKSANWLIAYFIIAIIHLVAIKNGSNLAIYSKYALMPVLALWLLAQKIDKSARNTLLLAIFMSWLGDIFLSLQGMNSNFFLVGILAFFGAHCFYIAQNLKGIGAKVSISIIFATAPMIGWAIFLLKMAHEKAGTMFVPVLVYSLVLIALYYSAIVARAKFNRTNWAILFYGAALFIASDSMIAINRFIIKMPFFDLAIMATYILAQFLIIFAHLRNSTTSSSD